MTYINYIGRMPFLWQSLFNLIFFVSSSHGALLWFSFHFSTMKNRSKTIYLRLLNCSVEIFAGKTSNTFVCQSGPKELLVRPYQARHVGKNLDYKRRLLFDDDRGLEPEDQGL